MKKSFWSKITGLNDKDLLGSEIEVLDKAIESEEKFFDQLEKETREKENSSELMTEPWMEDEGQLKIDVYQTIDQIVVQSAIAGVKQKDLNIAIEEDIVTIKGERKKGETEKADYLHQECFWGKFSRSIILPQEVLPDQAKASLKNGILTITLIKNTESGKKKSLKVNKKE